MRYISVIGLDIGQIKRPSAVCVVEPEWREAEKGGEAHFRVRFLERLALGASFPEVARRLAELAQSVEHRTVCRPRVFANLTGLGSPVLNLLRKAGPWVEPVYFNHGDQRLEEKGNGDLRIILGKAYLVSRLQTLLQTGRVHLPEMPEARNLADELLAYEITVARDANERYGAFSTGPRDDLVTALGLAVQTDPYAYSSKRVDTSRLRRLPGPEMKELMEKFRRAF